MNGGVVYVCGEGLLLVVVGESVEQVCERVDETVGKGMLRFAQTLTMCRGKLHEGPAAIRADQVQMVYEGDRLEWERLNVDRWDDMEKNRPT